MQSVDVHTRMQLTLQGLLPDHGVIWYATAAGDDESLDESEIVDGTVILHHGDIEPGEHFGTGLYAQYESFSATCFFKKTDSDPYSLRAKAVAAKVADALQHQRYGLQQLGLAEEIRIAPHGDFEPMLESESIQVVQWRHQMLLDNLTEGTELPGGSGSLYPMPPFDVRTENVTDDSSIVVYGYSSPNADPAESVWRIFQVDVSTGQVQWANGEKGFELTWNDWESYSYG